MTLREVPDLDHIVATLQDVAPAPTRGLTVPKGATSASPTPCPAPPWAGAPAQTPPAPSFAPLFQPSSSAGIIITLLQRSQAAFWAPSAKPVEGCDPQFSPTWALCFVRWGPGTPFLGSSPVPWPSPPPGLWGRFGSGVGSSGSPWHAVGQHCECSGHAGSSKPWHGAGPCSALSEYPPPHPPRP